MRNLLTCAHMEDLKILKDIHCPVLDKIVNIEYCVKYSIYC